MTKKRIEYNDEAGTHTSHRVTGNFYAYWDCSKCGHKSILGNVKSCPECGADKSTEKYRPPQGDEEKVPITHESAEQDGIDLVNHFSDETCRFCGADLKPGTQRCPECHAPLDDPAYVHRICPACERLTNDADCPDCGHYTVPKSEYQPSEEKEKPKNGIPVPPDSQFTWDEPKAPTFDYTMLKWVIGIGAAAILIVILAFLLWPKKQTATISQINWQSFVRLQEYQYNAHEGWDLPSSADLDGTSSKLHHYVDVLVGNHPECHNERVPDGSHQDCHTDTECHTETQYSGSHTECYGDGSCSSVSDYDTVTECEPVTDCDTITDYRDERVCVTVNDYRQDPVYQTWYSYHIWEWVNITPLSQVGTDLPITWADSSTIADNQRVAGQDADCSVTFSVDKKNIVQEVDCNQLPEPRYQVGARWEVRLVGSKIVSKKYLK